MSRREYLSDQVRSVIGTVAPSLATALGGPLAGAATREIATRVFGVESAEIVEIERRLAAPAPEDLYRLREADVAFQAEMEELGVQLEKIASDDRADARANQIKTQDWVPKALAIAYTVGFFAVVGFVLRFGLPDTLAGQAMLLLIGALTTRTDQIVSFYFASSAGSKEKTAILADQAASQRKVPTGLGGLY